MRRQRCVLLLYLFKFILTAKKNNFHHFSHANNLNRIFKESKASSEEALSISEGW